MDSLIGSNSNQQLGYKKNFKVKYADDNIYINNLAHDLALNGTVQVARVNPGDQFKFTFTANDSSSYFYKLTYLTDNGYEQIDILKPDTVYTASIPTSYSDKWGIMFIQAFMLTPVDTSYVFDPLYVHYDTYAVPFRLNIVQ